MISSSGGGHVPVLLEETLQLLDPREGERALDATLGLGGHARAVAERLGPEGLLVGIDRDDDALERARDALADVKPRVFLKKANFSGLEEVLDDCGVNEVDIVVFDFGVSSMQLDSAERGFSFREDGPLDMRMDAADELTAEDIVNDSSEEELADIIYRYGEERESRRIARQIVKARSRGRITRTAMLAELVERAKRERRGRIHPATRVFQALRMAVNKELESIELALDAAMRRLAPGGRMAVISFHSLEDRCVKRRFRDWREEGRVKLLNKKAVRASFKEREANPRSRSAKLRVLRREAATAEEE